MERDRYYDQAVMDARHINIVTRVAMVVIVGIILQITSDNVPGGFWVRFGNGALRALLYTITYIVVAYVASIIASAMSAYAKVMTHRIGEGIFLRILIVFVCLLVAAFLITVFHNPSSDNKSAIDTGSKNYAAGHDDGYESGYSAGKEETEKHAIELFDENIPLIQADAYSVGYKGGYDDSIAQFVEYADRDRGIDLWKLYDEYAALGYDNEPKSNPYADN